MQKDTKNVKEEKCFETKLKKKMVLLKIYNWVEIKHCKVKHDPLPISKNNVLLIKEWHILFIPFLKFFKSICARYKCWNVEIIVLILY